MLWLQVVLHGISLLWLLELPVARCILASLLPLARHSAPIRERLLVLVRKELYSTASQRRRLAVSAVCGLLESGALTGEDQMDLVVALRPVLSGDPRVADDTYSVLQHLIGLMCANGEAVSFEDVNRGTAGIEETVFSRQATDLIKETVSKRFQRLLEHISRADSAPTPLHSSADIAGRGEVSGLETQTGCLAPPDAFAPCMRLKLDRCFEISKLDSKMQVFDTFQIPTTEIAISK